MEKYQAFNAITAVFFVLASYLFKLDGDGRGEGVSTGEECSLEGHLLRNTCCKEETTHIILLTGKKD